MRNMIVLVVLPLQKITIAAWMTLETIMKRKLWIASAVAVALAPMQAHAEIVVLRCEGGGPPFTLDIDFSNGILIARGNAGADKYQARISERFVEYGDRTRVRWDRYTGDLYFGDVKSAWVCRPQPKLR